MKKNDDFCIVIPTLAKGGSELIASRLTKWLADKGMQVSLVNFFQAPEEWNLQPGIERIYINNYIATKSAATEKDIARALRDILHTKRPRHIVSFLTRMNIRVMHAAPLTSKVTVCERSYPPARNFPKEITRQIHQLYPKAHALVVQTEYCAQNWAKSFMPRDRTHILANPVIPRNSPPSPVPYKKPYILGVGRLVPEKNFPCLLKAFKIVTEKIPHFQLVIAGEGPSKTSLEQQTEVLGITNSTSFYGFCQNPAELFRQSSCFVLPSLYEGFPNVLLEAMWHGAPCIAADCPAGPAEMIGENKRGLLFHPDDSKELAQHILRIYADTSLRKQLVTNSTKHTSSFTEDLIFSQWLEMFY